MMTRWYFFISILLTTAGFAQDVSEVRGYTEIDSLYREDQFYFGLTYNVLQQRPTDLRQNKVSLGFSLGFLRDMPINEKRTFSIAAGLGYSLSTFNDNLQITGLGPRPEYHLITSGTAYDQNKIILNYVDLPVEIRWRTSTPDSHRFWRIYTGFKASYLFYDIYKFRGSEASYKISNNPDLSPWQVGTYLAVGYNTWNFHIYYGLNPLFKSAELEGEKIRMHALNLGLMFYIL